MHQTTHVSRATPATFLLLLATLGCAADPGPPLEEAPALSAVEARPAAPPAPELREFRHPWITVQHRYDRFENTSSLAVWPDYAAASDLPDRVEESLRLGRSADYGGLTFTARFVWPGRPYEGVGVGRLTWRKGIYDFWPNEPRLAILKDGGVPFDIDASAVAVVHNPRVVNHGVMKGTVVDFMEVTWVILGAEFFDLVSACDTVEGRIWGFEFRFNEPQCEALREVVARAHHNAFPTAAAPD